MTSTDVPILQTHSAPAALQGVRGPLPRVSPCRGSSEWDRVPTAGVTLMSLHYRAAGSTYGQAHKDCFCSSRTCAETIATLGTNCVLVSFASFVTCRGIFHGVLTI